MESDLRCNFRKCMRPLVVTAWVTSCSHVFCEEDGKREFARQMVCPACGESLSEQSSVIHIQLEPQEQYKSMALAGQRPDVVLDIASRSINLYCYQLLQGKLYQEFLAQKLTDKCADSDRKYNQFVVHAQGEISNLTEKNSRLLEENNELKRKQRDLTDSLNAKCKDYAKLQAFYQCLRRRQLDPRLGREVTENVDHMTAMTNANQPSHPYVSNSRAIVDGKSILGFSLNSPSRPALQSRPMNGQRIIGGGAQFGFGGQRLVQKGRPSETIIPTNHNRPNFLHSDVTRDSLNRSRIQIPKSPLIRIPPRKSSGKTPNLKSGHSISDRNANDFDF